MEAEISHGVHVTTLSADRRSGAGHADGSPTTAFAVPHLDVPLFATQCFNFIGQSHMPLQ